MQIFRTFFIAGRDAAMPDAIPVPRTVVRRLLLKIKPGGPDCCWFAHAPRTGPESGYSALPWKDEEGRKFSILAHRLSYLWFKGQIPEGMMVLHRCNNKGCFRPDHLYSGDSFDNARDRAAWERGEAEAGRVTRTAQNLEFVRAAAQRRRALRCDAVAA